MAILEKEIELVGSKGRKKVRALFDSGSSYSHIRPDLAASLETVIPLPEPMGFETAKKGEKVEARERVTLNFWIDGYRFSDEFMVVPELSEHIVIGTKTIQKWRFKLDFEIGNVIIDPRVTHLRLLKIL